MVKMEAFKNLIIDEFRDKAKGFVATEFKFTHTVNIKIDKVTKIPLRNDVIKVKVTFIDKDFNTLLTNTLSFENNVLNKTTAKKMVNVAPKELENRFNVAKKSIVSLIMDEYMERLSDAQTKINDLKSYYGADDGIIPHEFKGEQVKRLKEPRPEGIQDNNGKNKSKFDM